MAVPGLWTDREQIVQQVVRQSKREFALFGGSLVRTSDLEHFPCDIIEHDPLLGGAFRLAARGRIPPAQLDQIARHTFTVYIRGKGGSIGAAQEMIKAATALVRAGGLAVKIESSGGALAPQEWSKRIDPAHQPAGVYWTYVTLIRSHERGAYSCGMHNFGLRDAITSVILDPAPLAGMMHNFLGLGIQQHPLHDGERFTDDNGLNYRITSEPCFAFPEGHLQHNPYGMWRLELLE
jgi:hypothetical protein